MNECLFAIISDGRFITQLGKDRDGQFLVHGVIFNHQYTYRLVAGQWLTGAGQQAFLLNVVRDGVRQFGRKQGAFARLTFHMHHPALHFDERFDNVQS